MKAIGPFAADRDVLDEMNRSVQRRINHAGKGALLAARAWSSNHRVHKKTRPGHARPGLGSDSGWFVEINLRLIRRSRLQDEPTMSRSLCSWR